MNQTSRRRLRFSLPLALAVLAVAVTLTAGVAFALPQDDGASTSKTADAPTAQATDQGQDEQAANEDQADQPQGQAGDEAKGDNQSIESIDQLLKGEEAILAGEGYSYDPGDRRDPFKSLLKATDVPNFRGPRPDGIPGLLIDEVILTGIFRTDSGYVAQVQSAENEKSYLLKEGDQLYDGDVVRITGTEVVFKQIVQDPTALKPFREVVKTLSSERG